MGERALPDVIYEDVRARIVSGAMEPGQPVRQDTLAAELGVSKIPLREALARLERDGLVVSHRNRGFEVRGLSAEEAEEVFDLRLKIEPAAAALASRRASPEDRASAGRALDALDEALQAGGPDVSDRNRDFHLALVRPSGRELTTQLVERLHTLAERYVQAHLEPQGRTARARAEHHDLFDAWSAGRPHSVETLVRSHISGALEDLRRQLR
ncbi:MAG: GntR family transcriptional regulator [Proteobacteria bacterium]|nr:GntR family transcriptional regulator [Pseudomonadota bacterium]